ncbi:MAG: VCBS repeat-containing protein, partial [Gammaproteobacteria bacterium]|nr:VCBS repeat-containing protein [Gammaproteobacteria bacterium]
MADTDGDGRADVVGFYDDGVYVSKSTGTGFEAKKRWVATYGFSAGGWRVDEHLRMLSDVNGDGMADVVGFAYDGVHVSLSTGTSFKYSGIWKHDYGIGHGWTNTNYPRMLRDVNGDGLADIVGFGSGGVYVSLSTGTSFGGMTTWHNDFGYNDGYRGASHPRMVSDVNGDGLADLVVIAGNGVYVALSSGTKFLTRSHWVAQYGVEDGWQVASHPRMLADINGDRIPDMIGFDGDGVEASLSTGSDLEARGSWIGSFGYNAGWDTRTLADINGDGIDDIIGFTDAGVYTATSANDSGKPR